ncbi:uroporphyrinogen-III synthase [Bartonella sp. LJL80]
MAILVTRPLPGARRTEQHLRDMNLTPYVLPLCETRPLQINQKALIGDALIITSETVFVQMDIALQQVLFGKPLYCVGPRTAEAAKQAGFANIALVAGTAAQLVAAIDCPTHTQFLYLAGHVRGPDLERLLAERYDHVRVVEVYDTKPIKLNAQQLAALPKRIEVVMLYSAMAAMELEQIGAYLNPSTVLLCLSTRIAQAIPKTISQIPVIAYEPHEEAMLEGIEAVLV